MFNSDLPEVYVAIFWQGIDLDKRGLGDWGYATREIFIEDDHVSTSQALVTLTAPSRMKRSIRSIPRMSNWQKRAKRQSGTRRKPPRSSPAVTVAYMTAEFFMDIGYIAVVECIFGRARWLKTRRTGRLPLAPPTFWT